MAFKYSCIDYMQFQESLKKMRDMDDKIIYTLNSLPTESFRGQSNSETICKDIYQKINFGHKNRQEAIKDCILISANRIKELKLERETNPDEIQLNKKFKTEQRKLRLLQSELNVEDIVKERTLKAFSERCRSYINIGEFL